MSYRAIAKAREVRPVTIQNAVYAIQGKLRFGSKQEMVVWAVYISFTSHLNARLASTTT